MSTGVPAHPSSANEAHVVASWLVDARRRTLALLDGLSDEQLVAPLVHYTWPLKWEAGHAAWFVDNRLFERALGEAPLLPDGASLYDSIAVPRGARWELPLPAKEALISYLRAAGDRAVDRLRRVPPDARLLHYARFAVFHEDLHAETMLSTRQTLGYPAPPVAPAMTPGVPAVEAERALGLVSNTTIQQPSASAMPAAPASGGSLPGDASIPGGRFLLGATPGEPFVFDNELHAHPVELKPFAIARAPVTQAEFAAFVDDGGYRRRELWSDGGWRWRTAVGIDRPRFWRPGTQGGWERRDFDRWVPLEPHRPMVHVSWYEAEAYCRWVGRRLPTEAEWEAAALGEPGPDGRSLAPRKRRYPWGEAPPSPERAHLDWRGLGCLDVGALPASDSAFGCRQLLGNVWEWTSSPFVPYPGFEADEAYLEYSEPWFHTRRVLRGGGWATTSRLMRATLRNFYPPDRDNVWAGFRTCAL